MRFPILLTSFAALTAAAPTSSLPDTSDVAAMTLDHEASTQPKSVPSSSTPTGSVTSATSTHTKPSFQPYVPEETASCKGNICCGKNGRCWRMSPTDLPVKPPGA
ncbi:hypothetical protein QM012_001120 [Aureobasidium pullulans]|uniref:Hydrophobin n=1 Tax=Aureobasidium pullulans TaxID=5580 RepID=A0ABR0TH80_AURPU